MQLWNVAATSWRAQKLWSMVNWWCETENDMLCTLFPDGIVRNWATSSIPLGFTGIDLSGEELSRNVTWKWVIVQELNGCIDMIPVWNFNPKSLATCSCGVFWCFYSSRKTSPNFEFDFFLYMRKFWLIFILVLLFPKSFVRPWRVHENIFGGLQESWNTWLIQNN